METVLLAFAVLVVALALALALGASAWRRGSSRLVQSLVTEASSAAPREAPSDALPPVVARYLELALPGGPTGKRLARIRHTGEFRSREDRWSAFTSTEHFAASPPGFVWDARIRMAPGVSVRVRDGYAGGRGSMQASLFGLFTVLDAGDRQELDDGALMRYLAEAVWFPEALLPGPRLSWRELDASSAEATLKDGANEVALTFNFTDVGEVSSVETDRRFREVKGEYVPTPWRGRFRRWEQRGSFVIPVEGEVEWVLPEGPYPYWRGTIVAVEYEL